MPFQVFRPWMGWYPVRKRLVEQKVKGILVSQSNGLVGYVWSQGIRPRIFTPFLLYKICMGYWPSGRSRWLDIGQVLFLPVYGPRRSWGPLTWEKRTRPISSHLDRTSLVNKGFIIWDKTPKHDKFSLRDKARIPSGQDSSILPTWEANHSASFGSSCPLTELGI